MKGRMPPISRWVIGMCPWLAIALFPIGGLGQQESGQRLSRAEAVETTQALTAWFESEEYGGDAELRAVTRYGQSVVPGLITALNAGAPPATRELLRRSLDARYGELDEQARREPKFAMKSTRDEFTMRYLDGFDARYRLRAAQALAAIGGTDARQALEDAARRVEREEVRITIQELLKGIK